MSYPGPVPGKWFHLSWTTAHGRKLFKIVGASSFCERSISRLCCRRGWWMDGLAVLPDRIHLLLLVPPTATADSVLQALKQETSQAIRTAGPLPRHAMVWSQASWCSEVGNPAVLTAIRQKITRLRLRRWGADTKRSVRQ